MHGVSQHFCKEAVAVDAVRVSKEDALTNLADLFTKVLGKVKMDGILKKLMCQESEFSPEMVSHYAASVLVEVSTAHANQMQAYLLNMTHLRGPSKYWYVEVLARHVLEMVCEQSSHQ